MDPKFLIEGLALKAKGKRSPKSILNEIAAHIGIEINGKNPWDIQVFDERFYSRVVANGSIGFGEAYMEGWWETEQLDELFYRITLLRNRNLLDNPIRYLGVWLEAKILNRQTKGKSKKVIDAHYNLSNEMYQAMLGKTMAYTCAYWKEAKTLDDAQNAKYDLVCRKLDLKPEDQVLELGCGWGGFANFAHKNFGCRLVSVNISEEQIKFARQNYPDAAQFYLCDYRDPHIYNASGLKFDKVVSIGMCEHVGVENYKSWMQLVADQMKDQSLFLLHTIGSNEYEVEANPWIDKYIFPKSALPSPKSLGNAIDRVFTLEDWHDFGVDYDRTLLEWFKNFDEDWEKGEKLPQYLKLKKMDRNTFYRMWKYYLLSVAGCFRSRYISLWQLVLSKNGVLGGYQTVR
ncbi:MAG: cyclopropane fatty acyl phospholipid synthase [SAR324 cluster bacterium]|nr:cyclopropane fatty acyl phospholipid synthase [SAR324 cluster bacterium]